MRILLVNKFHYLKGGSEKYYFELAKLLKNNGHEIAFFSMQDEKNIKTDCKEYFVKTIELNTGSKLQAVDIIYSKENKKKMKEALEDFNPDIVHLNNFQRQLSASIIEPIKKREIPIVYTAHDVQAICPAILMLDNEKNICEKCMGGKYLNCIKKKCNKGSILKSVIGALEGIYYRKKKIFTKTIDKIITPTDFYKRKFIEDGINEKKIVTLHNFIDTKEYDVKNEDQGYALYIGRLSKEKGIMNLLKAFEKLEEGTLYIAGEGQDKGIIQEFIHNHNLTEKVKILGFLNHKEIIDIIRKCKFVVVPSIWYENCPYSILETLAIGKPVIGANIGGIPELVKDEKNGLLFKYDDIADLSAKMKRLYEDEELVRRLQVQAKEQAKKDFDKQEYYEHIIKIYENLIKEKL